MLFAGCVATKTTVPLTAMQTDVPRVTVAAPYNSKDFVYQGTNITVSICPTELTVHKNRGPTTVDFLLDYQLEGDFEAEMVVEFATPEELGTGFNGGTPVPYYGLRTPDGRTSCQFNLVTYHPKGKQYNILLKRDEGKVSAFFDDKPERQNGKNFPNPGYIYFMMNDVSRVRLHYVRVEAPPGKVLMEHGRCVTSKTESAQQTGGDSGVPAPHR